MTRITGRVALAAPALLAILAAATLPAGLSAQRAPAFAGVEVRGGVAFPERAEAGLGVMGEVDLGYVWRPELRAIVGLSRMRANIDREPGDDEGSFTATGVWFGARYDLFALSTTAAYVRGAVTIQRVSADAWDADVDALLSGTNAGAAIALGARRALDATGRLGGTLEVRRTILNNLSHTAVEIGVRWQQRGVSAYYSDPVALAPPLPSTEPVAERRTPPAVPAAERQPAAVPAAEPPAPTAAAPPREATSPDTVRPAAPEPISAAERARSADAAVALLRQGVNRAAALMRSAAGVRETDDALVMTLSGTAFASGSGSLSPAARTELRALATVLAGYPGHIISIEGHTDGVGDAAANQRLSAERAAAVRAGLIAEGVDPLWTAMRAFGAGRPIATNDTASGRAANRRVEIQVLKRRCVEPPRPGTDGGLVCPR